MASYLHITTQMITFLCREHILNGNWMVYGVNTTCTVFFRSLLTEGYRMSFGNRASPDWNCLSGCCVQVKWKGL